ncbi:MAG: hypothetical protein ABH871_02680 [Pseudomonadota bacterium]
MNRTETPGKNKSTWIIAIVTAAILIALFTGAMHIPPDTIRRMGITLPLPAFTFVIAIIDGFNPCNMFVLTLLLGFLVSASHSRLRIYMVGYTFVVVVGAFYYLFMAAWLNVFKYIGFVDPLRITIALIALAAGVINCKELFFYKKGVSLTIQDAHRGPLYRKVRKMKDTIVMGSMPALLISSVTLALFSSLIELPCTAGFPIIYTGVLSGKYLQNSFHYYLYLFYYIIVYVFPLVVIIGIFGFILKARKISERQVQIIKFIGGAIMILLGIILLVNPGLIMEM